MRFFQQRRFQIWWLLALCCGVTRLVAAQATSAGAMGEIIAGEGKIEWAEQPGVWKPAAVGQKLKVGDSVRTGEFSRATLRLPAGSVLRIDEFTTLRVQESLTSGKRATAVVSAGGVFLYSRTSPEEIDFATPVATGAIKGTEVLIRVEPNGASSITVLEGAVDLTPKNGLANAAVTSFASGEKAEIKTDGTVTRTAVIDAVAPVQWALYYPAVLDPAAAEAAAGSAWRDAWTAYRRGALPAAIAARPASTPQTDAEKLLAAALALAAGRFELTEIRGFESEPARALRVLAAVAARGPNATEAKNFTPSSATGWLAVSYARQSAADLPGALAAARSAAELAPASGYAWARVGELEFAAGRRVAAETALVRALAVAPELASARALRGFVAAADGRKAEADGWFAEALKLDPALAPARLGAGILAYGRGETERGRLELIAAAAMDPAQSLPRSYLAKAWLDAGQLDRAAAELVIAARLDAGDPTPALYSALLAQRQNRPNAAVEALERSVALNDNRGVYRSRLLLDEDRAVRRANLASIYDSAGGREIAFREASRAVRNDPANYSAQLFLANAYDQLRDPLRVNLRYETPWSGSLLLARLLAPANAGAIAPSVGLGEYTALFEPQRFTWQGEAVVLDTGEWRQTLSHTGNFGASNYALEVTNHRFPGEGKNQDFTRDEVTAVASHQFTPDDTMVVSAYYENTRGGDVRVGVPAGFEDLESRFRDQQLPILTAGYRHHWRPGSETLAMVARLDDDSRFDDPRSLQSVFQQEPDGRYTLLFVPTLSMSFRNRLEIYHAELAHIEQRGNFSLQGGARFQDGHFESQNRFTEPTPLGLGFPKPAAEAKIREPFQRTSVYGYATWKFAPGWSALVGASGDWLTFPTGLFVAPITRGKADKTKVSPKAGLVWEPSERWSVRAAHTESVGGVSFEESFRLEPVQFGGFTQGVRSLVPEAIGGSTNAAEFKLDGLGVTAKWAGRLYFDLEAQQLRSEAERQSGVFSFDPFPTQPYPVSLREQFNLRERRLVANALWLVSSTWSLTAGAEWVDAELEQAYPLSLRINRLQRSHLFAPKARISWNSPKGFFWRTETSWLRLRGEVTSFQGRLSTVVPINATQKLPGRNAWNTDMTFGYRAPSLKWTAALGVENLWNTDLALDALVVPRPLPLQRAFFGRVTWSF